MDTNLKLLKNSTGKNRVDLSYEAIYDTVLNIATLFKRSGSEGVMFGRIGDRDKVLLPRRVYHTKRVIPLKGNTNSKIKENVKRCVAVILDDRNNKGEDPEIAVRANWYFAEYTDKTRSLEKNNVWIQERDFKGRSKNLVYFDVDMKDNISKSVYAVMTPKDKEDWVVKEQRVVLEKVITETDPCYITFTGNGMHLAYKAENLLFSDSDFNKSKEAYQDAYEAKVDELYRLTGYKFDLKCKSINRIDRLPLTYNIKPDVADAFTSFLYFNPKASTTFMRRVADITTSPEIYKKVYSNAAKKLGMYRALPVLKDSNHQMYSYIRPKLSFKKIFEYFKIKDILLDRGVVLKQGEEGFITTRSPFRTRIFEDREPESEERIPSFRVDEKSSMFYDFGVVPGAEDVNHGDVLGLVYAIDYYRDKGDWPTTIPVKKAVQVALRVIGGKTEKEIMSEKAGFLRDEKGNVMADLDNILVGVVQVLLRKYEIVFNKVQRQMLFRDRGTTSSFKLFPWECTEFGTKDKATIGRSLLNAGGLGKPTGQVAATAKQVVDIITDPVSVKFTKDGLHAYWAETAVRDFIFPVIDMDRPVIKFEDNMYYHIRTGDVTDSYDGYAYNVTGVRYEDLMDSEKCEAPLFTKLLKSTVGAEDSSEQMVFRYMMAQMWLPAHGDSRALIIRGNGKNGKSTLNKILTKLLPDGIVVNTTTSTLTGTTSSESSDRMSLLGKHLILIGDNDERSLNKKLKFIITGEQGLTARYLYQNPVKFDNTATLIFMVNELPKIVDSVSAFLRRFLVIESKVKIRKSILNMDDKIIENEKIGVWSYIIKAVEYFRKNYDFAFPEDEQWAKEIFSPMKRQLLNQFSTGEMAMSLVPEAGCVVNVRKLFNYYGGYAKDISVRQSSLKNFAERIAAIVESDHDIYGDKWQELFEAEGMEEHMVTVYNNGQLEYIINAKFEPPVLSEVKEETMNMNIDIIFQLRRSVDTTTLNSVRYPMSPSSEILLRLKEWVDRKKKKRVEKVANIDNRRSLVLDAAGGGKTLKEDGNEEEGTADALDLL